MKNYSFIVIPISMAITGWYLSRIKEINDITKIVQSIKILIIGLFLSLFVPFLIGGKFISDLLFALKGSPYFIAEFIGYIITLYLLLGKGKQTKYYSLGLFFISAILPWIALLTGIVDNVPLIDTISVINVIIWILGLHLVWPAVILLLYLAIYNYYYEKNIHKNNLF